MACRVSSSATPAADAYRQCSGMEPASIAESVPMSSLVAGDFVLATRETVSRVLFNQHVPSAHVSTVVSLHHASGSLSLTPDHVLQVDGEWAAARSATKGSVLSDGTIVQRVTSSTDGIINPLTTTGTILANGIVASTYPEWVAAQMLSARFYPLPISLCNLLTFLFPAKTQAFYDALIEPLFTAAGGNRAYLEAVPFAVAVPVMDVLVATVFTVRALLVPAAVGITTLLLARKLKA